MKRAAIAAFIVFAAVVSARSQNNTFPSSGNVGIGTTTPQARLHISQGDLLLQNSGSGYPILWLKDVSGNQALRLDYNSFIMSGNSLYIRSASPHHILLNDIGGNVGIGTSTPAGKLDVAASFYTSPGVIYIRPQDSGTEGGELVLTGSGSYNPWSLDNNGGHFRFHHSGSEFFRIKSNGNVGIGTTAPDSKLTVKGVIHAEEVKVDLAVPGPDYVFDESYPLRSLEDTKTFIDQNKHLPGIPSSDEMQQNGVNLLEMNMKLLEKVEELTLHLIEQGRKLEQQQNEIDALKANITKE